MISKIKQLFSFRFCLMLVVFCVGNICIFLIRDINSNLNVPYILLFLLLFVIIFSVINNKSIKQDYCIFFLIFYWIILYCIINETKDELHFSIMAILLILMCFVSPILVILCFKSRRVFLKSLIYNIGVLLGTLVILYFCVQIVNYIRSKGVLENFISAQKINKLNKDNLDQKVIDIESIQWRLVKPSSTVFEDQVFLNIFQNNHQYHSFAVLDKKTAQKQWEFKCYLPISFQEKYFTNTYSAPVVLGDTVYFMCNFTLYAKNRYTGQTSWAFPLTVNDRKHYSNSYDLYQSLIIYKGNLYVIDKKLAILYALDPKTGHIKWQHQFESSMTERLSINGADIIYGYVPISDEMHLKRYFLDAQTGQERYHDMINNENRTIFFDYLDPEVIKRNINYTTKCSGARLCAINIKNGAIIWDYHFSDINKTYDMEPMAIGAGISTTTMINGDLLLMVIKTKSLSVKSTYQYELYAFNIKERKNIWHKVILDGKREELFSLLIVDDIVYIRIKWSTIRLFNLQSGYDLGQIRVSGEIIKRVNEINMLENTYNDYLGCDWKLPCPIF